MECPECKSETEHVDETFSNITTHRCNSGEKTGDIYLCENCNQLYIFNYLTDSVEYWNY